jgi:oxalate decarboxylase
MGHYILNSGIEPGRFLEMFRGDRYAGVSLNQWLALTPPELVQAHLNLDDATTTAVTAYKGRPIIIQ